MLSVFFSYVLHFIYQHVVNLPWEDEVAHPPLEVELLQQKHQLAEPAVRHLRLNLLVPQWGLLPQEGGVLPQEGGVLPEEGAL